MSTSTARTVNSSIGPYTVASKVFSDCLGSSAGERQQATSDCLDYHRIIFKQDGKQTWTLEKSKVSEVCKSCGDEIPAGTDRFENVLTFDKNGTECYGSWHPTCLGIVHYSAHAKSQSAITQYGPGCPCITESVKATEGAPLKFTIGDKTRLISETDQKLR